MIALAHSLHIRIVSEILSVRTSEHVLDRKIEHAFVQREVFAFGHLRPVGPIAVGQLTRKHQEIMQSLTNGIYFRTEIVHHFYFCDKEYTCKKKYKGKNSVSSVRRYDDLPHGNLDRSLPPMKPAPALSPKPPP